MTRLIACSNTPESAGPDRPQITITSPVTMSPDFDFGPATAAVYLRISQDRTGQQLGVQRQKQDCLDLARRLGLEVTRVFPAALGGSGGGLRLVHLCPTCEASHAETGADGLGAMSDAVLAYVDPERRGRRGYGAEKPSLGGVLGWAATGLPPNLTPWAHHDLEGLREGLERGW